MLADCSYPSQLAERRGRLQHHWTASQLKAENRDFLAGPSFFRYAVGGLLFGMAAPNSQHEYLLPDMKLHGPERVDSAEADILALWPQPSPYVRRLKPWLHPGAGSRNLALSARTSSSNLREQRASARSTLRRLINAVVVGEPRNGSTKAT